MQVNWKKLLILKSIGYDSKNVENFLVSNQNFDALEG